MSYGMMDRLEEGNFGWGVVVEDNWRKGPWTAEEDKLLIEYVRQHGEGRWNSVSQLAGLKRNGKSCRLRWVNYLRPDLKRGNITPNEERIILELHAKWGNRWSTIARSLPGRTDNEIKNYWRTHFKKKGKASPDDEKEKLRLLRKQQFQQQQQKQQEQQEQQELNHFDMKRIMSLLDENESYFPQSRVQDNNTGYNYAYNVHVNTNCEEHNCYSAFNNNSTMDDSNERILWDGLWTLEDLAHGHGDINTVYTYTPSKPGMQQLAAPF